MCTVLCIYDIIYILQETGGGGWERDSHEQSRRWLWSRKGSHVASPSPLKSWLRPCWW